ncbi:TIGR02391 family protein [Ferroacidibacillus organovorans]|uniref:Conserved hypothetical protein CHP02391 domain-containing protein n=1 Tax=Ferroacidibacillus organovorans TaxID=1765683 RepID=A0A853K7A0_9BACL|nr:TIGR02391 family protein [Ferroacidibacillus organovorans]KYP79599.1 hypothetical protein AYJ22_14145 [Ferroacidibacillus organovorans]OAG91650.1 hypothetical protein AYW79_13695 [Ferroacidibacillus organovorans]
MEQLSTKIQKNVTIITTLVSEDVWSVARDNYERGSYTNSITNSLQYVNEIVREKSGLSLDNTKLMDEAFLGQSPKLKINKLQTQTEKDIQAGVGYLLKGLCLAVRNPRAHERYNDNKEVADTIIQFVSYVLDFVRNSKQPSLVEDWLEFVFDENFNNSKEYSKIVLQEIPEKKKYELLVNIFRFRERARENQLNNLINELMESITSDECDEFIYNLNKELLQCADNTELRMFLSIYPPEKWSLLVPITRLKIEHMVKKSLEQAKMVGQYADPFDNDSWEYHCNQQGVLSTFGTNSVTYFETKEEILTILGHKLSDEDPDIRSFVIEHYQRVVFGSESTKNLALIYGIKRSLSYHDRNTFEHFKFLIDAIGDHETRAVFGNEVASTQQYFDNQETESEKPHKDSEDELPF